MTSVTCIPEAVAEAARWHLLARLFERPRLAWRAEVRALAREVDDAALRAAALAAAEGDEGRYLRLLGPGGAASPREAGACGLRDPGWILADVRRCYDAFGYAPRAEDPTDHVAVEVGFVAYLHLKEAVARSVGDDEAFAVTRAARDGFVHAHLAPLAGALARRLAAAGGEPVAVAAGLLAARVPAADAPAAPAPDPLAEGCGACLSGLEPGR